MARQKWQEWAENEDRLSILAAWARAGKTDEEIAKLIGISRSTLSEWKKKHESIGKTLSITKDYADRLIEGSLYKIACGYTVTNKKPIKTRHVTYTNGVKTAEDEIIEYAEETIYVPGEARLIMFWLENRMPEWRKRYEKARDLDGDEENQTGTVVMSTDIAEDIKQLMEEEKSAREEKERREEQDWKENR
ncbi:helix-turn-helix domain-containing protein [Enterocloster citroniae]|uniref:helix-turn-helix domain-containing protein n=1 Tax=Enterocloster citroniae TaxID=358743 RepID=UPI002E78CE12|nr:helix-turn-helix domain-containing protein [Enterocloster citroniae]